MDVPVTPGVPDQPLADVPPDGEVGVQAMPAPMPLGHPDLRQRLSERPAEPPEEDPKVGPQGDRIVAARPGVCQGAEAIEPVRGAVPSDLASGSSGGVSPTVRRRLDPRRPA